MKMIVFIINQICQKEQLKIKIIIRIIQISDQIIIMTIVNIIVIIIKIRTINRMEIGMEVIQTDINKI